MYDYMQHLAEERESQLVSHRDIVNKFKDACGTMEVYLEDDNFDYIPTIGVIARYPDLVSYLAPKLVRDKEGLVDFRNLFQQFDKNDRIAGYLYSEYYVAMLSPLFRRGYCKNSNWAPCFVDIFWNVNDEDIESYILLDFDRVRLDVGGPSYGEMDTWFGPPYKDQISEIADGATKLRPPLDLEDHFVSIMFHSAYSLDVMWTSKGNIKSFQAMEFANDTVTIDLDGETYFPVRYLHAEFDIERKTFRHFDGAVQYLSEAEYYARRDSDFRHNLKVKAQIKPISKKVFKFNGRISVEMWKEFFAHFCTGNPLVYEYFTGCYPDYLEEKIKIHRKNIQKRI